MKISAIKTDSARREAGDWVKEIPDLGDLELKVRGIGNSGYRALQQTLMRTVPDRGERRRGTHSPETQDKIALELAIENLLVDWKNLADDKGKPIPYSKEKARELLSNPDLRALLEAVMWAAGVVADDAKDEKKVVVAD